MTTKDHLRAAGIIARVLDDQFKLLGLGIGFDPLLDLVPGFGSFLATFLGFYLIWLAWKLEIPEEIIARMIRNILLNFLIGEIPLVGALASAFYKSNRTNYDLLRKYAPKDTVEGEILQK
ncbi:DUF4112 domain-containing protein [Patescibacteria group bacterium]|nr:DUF4112 domain-containing protein [Patescibacteria group bacterium]